MTVEELTAQLEAANASVQKLTQKNSELIDREKKAKAEANAAQDAADQAAEDAARKSHDLTALEQATAKRYEKQIKDLTAERDAGQEQLRALLIDNGIKDALTANNVAPQFHRAVTALMKTDATLKDGAALIGDTPLADYAKTFLASDDGKHFVAAPANSGAGAVGSSHARAHTFTKENFSAREGEWLAMAKTDPMTAKAIAAQVGRSDLASTL